MIIGVKNVEHIEGFELKVTFDNNEIKRVNLENSLLSRCFWFNSFFSNSISALALSHFS